MGDDGDLAAPKDLGRNRGAPVRQESRDGVFEALGERQLGFGEAGVARVSPRVAGIASLQGRRRHVIAAPPQKHLLLAELRGRFGFVQPLQRAVMALVQAPGMAHRDPHQVHPLQRKPERLDGAFQHRCIRAIEDEAGLLQHLAGALRFLHAALREVHVGPAGEAVFHVPDRFTVAQQNDFMHMEHSRRGARSRRKKAFYNERLWKFEHRARSASRGTFSS